MKSCDNLFSVKGQSIHILRIVENNLSMFTDSLKKYLTDNGFFAIIDLKSISSENDLFTSFVKAFHFPDYFGYNWDAFDECINDLDWIDADRYILILKNIEKLNLNEFDKKLLSHFLKKATEEWENGRNYDSFPTPPTPFHIIFYSEEISINELAYLLKSYGIKDIDIIET